MNFPGRQQKVREVLAKNRLDALLINHLPNIRYLCGFTGSAGFLLVRQQEKGAKLGIARHAVLNAVAEWLAGRRKKSSKSTIGIEAEHLTLAEKKRLDDELPAGIRLRNTVGLVERDRMVKDVDELKLIRDAVRLGSTLFDRILEVLKPGVRESEVAAEMEYAARTAGAEEMSFPTIIASGARSALPHGRASEQVVQPGGFVVCDFGVILAGYCSDQTRTVWVGTASEEARRAYAAVKDAQAAAIAAVRPGARVEQVDAAARKVLRKAGLGRYFTHSTGHGVGLEIHEAPRVAAGQEQVLESGMVITVEPGVYFPQKWGVRIEDMVAVNESGCEVLTPTSKDFLAV